MTKKMCLLFIVFGLSFLVFPYGSYSEVIKRHPYTRLYVPANATGPVSIAFAPNRTGITNVGPYASISDGRIVRYGNIGGFHDFAVVAPNRSKALCDGKRDHSLEHKCGRPMGLAFNQQTKMLYIADAYFGLAVVGHQGGMAQQLATGAHDIPFGSLSGLDIDSSNGAVYFTDASTRFQRRQISEAIKAGDSTGRLLRYDPSTKQVTVLLANLSLPLGVAVSSNNDFVLITEYINKRCIIYWIGGPKRGQSETFVKFVAEPINIRRNRNGEFWVALNNATSSYGIKLSPLGEVQQTVTFDVENESFFAISEVVEYGPIFLVGSYYYPYISVYAS